MLLETGKELVREADRRRRDGNRACADFGIGANFLSDRKRVLHQSPKVRAKCSAILRQSESIL